MGTQSNNRDAIKSRVFRFKRVHMSDYAIIWEQAKEILSAGAIFADITRMCACRDGIPENQVTVVSQ
ncbi:hypothetical protein PspLS_02178 [Pyricularia sp. CBS 133598]|nr:hypothetical protein PspLS_02178 [Pyricularia sp. CBS 133598]